MKNLFLSLVLLFPMFCFGQFGVCFHQSNLPAIGLNYEFFKLMRIESRIGVDYSLPRFNAELDVLFDIVNKETFEFYFGAGVRGGVFEGLVTPVGINFYPFTNKNVGFHIEAAPIFSEPLRTVLRGSWGIRYRFHEKPE